MSEAMTNAAEVPLAVRVLTGAIRSSPALLAAAVLGAGLGAWSASFVERPYYTQATVEIGVRHPKQPIESPIVAAERLQGHLAAAAAALEPAAWVAVEARRNPAANYTLMRYLDLSVGARTASVARAIADRGVASFLAEHEGLFRYERHLLDEEREHWARWAKKVDDALETAPPKSATSAFSPSELSELEEALFESKRHINACATLMNEVRTPPTRLVARPSDPAQPASKAVPRAIAGALAGTLLAALLLGARALARTVEGQRA